MKLLNDASMINKREKYVLFVAYKKQRLVYDCLYAILTLNHVTEHPDYHIVVYTDQAELFLCESQRLKLKNLTIINIKDVPDWIHNGYAYAVKIFVLKQFFNTYKGKVLLFDCDSFFIKGIDGLFERLEDSFLLYDKDIYISDFPS